MKTIAKMVAELRAAESHYGAMDVNAVTDRDTKKLLDTQKRLAAAVSNTPAKSFGELRLKFDLLLHWQGMDCKWTDELEWADAIDEVGL